MQRPPAKSLWSLHAYPKTKVEMTNKVKTIDRQYIRTPFYESRRMAIRHRRLQSGDLRCCYVPDKTAGSAAHFLEQVLGKCACRINTDNVRKFQRNPEHCRKSPARFLNDCNWVNTRKVLGNLTPGEKLCLYFFSQDFVNNF